MKRIEDFLLKTNAKSINDSEMNKINGSVSIPSTSSWTESNSSGCTLYVTDVYFDSNNNGNRDCNEVGFLLTKQVCPTDCPPV